MKRVNKVGVIAFILVLAFLLCGCEGLSSTLSKLNESLFGQPFTLVEYDQFGNVSVPEDLPKTTLLSIDGKQMHLHRTNYNIIDASLLD